MEALLELTFPESEMERMARQSVFVGAARGRTEAKVSDAKPVRVLAGSIARRFLGVLRKKSYTAAWAGREANKGTIYSVRRTSSRRVRDTKFRAPLVPRLSPRL